MSAPFIDTIDSFPGECLIYLLWGGFVQALCATVFAPAYYLIVPVFTSRSTRSTALWAYPVFNVWLLFWGVFGHYAFLMLTYGKLYVSVDRVVDWFPFIPFGQWVLDQTLDGKLRGDLIGSATLGQLRWIWLAVAFPVWLLTVASTWATFRVLRQKGAAKAHSEGLQPDAV